MEVSLKIPVQDFNQDFIKSLKSVMKNFKSGELTITIKDQSSPDLAQESATDYEKRLLTSIEDLDKGKGIVFSKESLEAYVKDLVKE